jgi:phosphatidylinositol alpha-1,6-mannosyltransferase
VLEGVTGVTVDGRSPAQVVDALAALLLDRDRAAQLGRAGRAWVEREWRWDVLAERLRSLLAGAGPASS